MEQIELPVHLYLLGDASCTYFQIEMHWQKRVEKGRGGKLICALAEMGASAKTNCSADIYIYIYIYIHIYEYVYEHVYKHVYKHVVPEFSDIQIPDPRGSGMFIVAAHGRQLDAATAV